MKSRSADYLIENSVPSQGGQASRRQLGERGVALGGSAAGIDALGAIAPMAEQERFVRSGAAFQGEETLGNCDCR